MERKVSVVKQAAAGMPVAKLIRKVGISSQTLCRWKAKDFSLEIDQRRRMKQTMEQNLRVNSMAAEQTLDEA